MKFSEDFSADELYWIREVVREYILEEMDYIDSDHPSLSWATKLYDEIIKLVGED